MNKPIDTLFKKEMSRKEFLATVGVGAATVLGLSTILRFAGLGTAANRPTSTGYGSSAYGGKRAEGKA